MRPTALIRLRRTFTEVEGRNELPLIIIAATRLAEARLGVNEGFLLVNHETEETKQLYQVRHKVRLNNYVITIDGIPL
jgi:hypothetical protein